MKHLFDLGRRTERLLYGGVFLAILCIALFLFTESADLGHRTATIEAVDYVLKCIDDASMKRLDGLTAEIRRFPNLRPTAGKVYVDEFTGCFLRSDSPSGWQFNGTYEIIGAHAARLVGSSAASAVKSFRDWRDELENESTKFYQFELPSNVALEIAGNKIKSPIGALVVLLKIALGPFLFIWITSFASTRMSELLCARAATSSAFLFPHVLNCFPTQTDIPMLRRNKKLSIKSVKNFAAFIRIFTVSIIMLFTVGAYMGAVADLEHPLPFFLTLLFLFVPAIIVVCIEGSAPAMKIHFFERIYGPGNYPG
jgi:hypothetical protein